MMKIWKYPLNPHGETVIETPPILEFAHFGRCPEGALCVWVFVCDNGPREPHKLRVVGTGEEVATPGCGRYIGHIGTYIDGDSVWHLMAEDDFDREE
jgi:hypothetical protein